MRNESRTLRYVLGVIAVMALTVGMGMAVNVKASAATVTPGNSSHRVNVNVNPYGGCDEAWQAPRSPGAADCRRLGWFVNRWVIVSPDGQAATYKPLQKCANEDVNVGVCYWDAMRRGNHAGHGFIAWPGRTLYVDYVNGRRVTMGPLQREWFLKPWVG